MKRSMQRGFARLCVMFVVVVVVSIRFIYGFFSIFLYFSFIHFGFTLQLFHFSVYCQFVCEHVCWAEREKHFRFYSIFSLFTCPPIIWQHKKIFSFHKSTPMRTLHFDSYSLTYHSIDHPCLMVMDVPQNATMT